MSMHMVDQESWTPEKLSRAIASTQSVSTESLVRWFGGPDELKKGSGAKLDDLWAAFAIQAPGAKSVEVVSDREINEGALTFDPQLGLVPKKANRFRLSLKSIGESGLFVGAAQLSQGQGFGFHYVADGTAIGDGRTLEAYTMPPESKERAEFPAGKLEQQPRLTSKVFGDTWHDWWIWTPASFDPTQESNLVVFQDGQWAHNYAPIYFQNLCGKGDLPQTIVVFVTPGTFADGKSDRSREYDTLSDAYSRFLLDELLPPVEHQFKVTQDPSRRCVAGLSSGGICSFTVAWNRPDKFGLVMSWIGSFANIASGDSLREGGHNYPAVIRKSEVKKIRVFLQDGLNDLDNVHGNWPLGNKQMELALKFKGYDYWSVWGNGFHSDAHGRACMPDALRWLFQSSKVR